MHGDLGRTVPSIGSLLNCEADILQLDVTNVEDRWSSTEAAEGQQGAQAKAACTLGAINRPDDSENTASTTVVVVKEGVVAAAATDESGVGGGEGTGEEGRALSLL